MLLEYNVDTVDEKMVPRAVELRRRVAARRLQEQIERGRLGAESLLRIKESSRAERHTHVAESMVLAEVMHKERIAVGRAAQQLDAAGQLRVLGRDVARASRLSKANKAVLSDLQQRITAMRGELQKPQQLTVQQELSAELMTNDRRELESQFSHCPHCEKKLFALLLPQHVKMCAERWQDRQRELHQQLAAPAGGRERRNSYMAIGDASTKAASSKRHRRRTSVSVSSAKLDADGGVADAADAASTAGDAAALMAEYGRRAVYDVGESVVAALATFPPQPPRHCTVLAKGATFIEWRWLPPVIDGGLAVTNYEIAFTTRITEFDKLRKKFTRWEEHVPSLLTSRWCFREGPVANRGFRITNLRAGTEYTNFRIRCCNLRGWSEWVDMITGDAFQQQLQRQQEKQQESGAEAGVFALERQMGPVEAAGPAAAAGASPSRKLSDAPARAALGVASESDVRIEQAEGFIRGFSVFTDEPEAPSPPLFVTCERVTSSCIHLSWSPPFYDGGSALCDYVVHYTVLEQQITVTARNVIVEHTKKFNLNTAAQSGAVIRNLLPDTDVVRVAVTAVNAVGLISERAPMMRQKVVRTQPCSRYSALSRELAFAAKSSEPLIDTAFFTVLTT